MSFNKENLKGIMIKALIFFGACLLLSALFVLIINLAVVGKTDELIYSHKETEKIEGKYDCILVLGAGVKADGTPTHMLEDRLLAAETVYSGGKAPVIFISGDSHQNHHDEISSMKAYLVSLGVSENEIVSDGYGLSTYESIYRIKEVYGYKNIIIITQKYHLYRALYIAEQLGINAIGVSSDLRTYRKQVIYSCREYMARVKDVIYTQKHIAPTYSEAWKEAKSE